MAQSVRAPIEGRSRRLRLEARKEPYWCTIERGLAVGYLERPLPVGWEEQRFLLVRPPSHLPDGR